MCKFLLCGCILYLEVFLRQVQGSTAPGDGYVNVALNKPTRQIHTSYEGWSYLATDGNTAGHFYQDQTCTHTDTTRSGSSWWMVDLLSDQHIEHIKIYNRIDDHEEMLANFSIYVSKDNPWKNSHFTNDSGVLCYHRQTQVVRSATIRCVGETKARYVYVWKPDSFLTLCEFEVLVKATVPRVRYVSLEIQYDVRHNQTTPFLSTISTTGIYGCAIPCFASQAAVATVAQFHSTTHTCQCLEYSTLTALSDDMIADAKWTTVSLSNN